jgi:hypothetical protein
MFTQLATLVVAGALLVACSGRSPAPVPANGQPAGSSTQQSTGADGLTLPDFAFTPARGAAFTIALKGYGTSGYQWHLVDGFDRGVVAQQQPGEGGTASRMGNAPSGGLVGASAPEIFDFKAMGPGRTALRFSLYRSWEGPAAATETRSFSVTVE